MNNIKNKIKSIAAVALVGASVSSCSLDMLPLNDVVLENYWTNKSDVESVVASCYGGMQEGGYVSQMIAWGETRSDNVAAGPNVPANLNNMMKGSLKTTNPYCDWAAIYNVINRCNTVLYYAPIVAEEDPNYTESDLRVTIAECKALRAISYLTLIKTFKDVPFTLEPSIDDNMEYRLPQTKFEMILDSLIADIEGCKDDAPRRYSEIAYNTGKITRAAMYSILAELYLWRASDYQLPAAQQNEYYRKCIEACDWVLNYKIQQYNDNNIEDLDLTKLVDSQVWQEYGYPLLAESGGSGSSSIESAAAFISIFGTGSSFESIFELTYYNRYIATYTVNEDVGFMYGGNNSTGSSVRYLYGNENLMTQAPSSSTFNNTTLFPVNTDYRSLTAFRYTDNGSFEINKYAADPSYFSVSYRGNGTIDYSNLRSQDTRSYSQMYMNWILYRMTEIMLFRAEAEIELAGNMNKMAEAEPDDENNAEEGGEEPAASKPRKASVAVNGSSLVTAEELYDDAFNLISAIYVRANPATKTTSAAKPSRVDFKTLEDFETLLMYERQRELLFEGKRYYDLVRRARREGNTNKFITTLSSKFGEGGAAVANKMKQMDFMYMPIYKTQMQVNPNLVQNSAYADEDEIVNN